MSLSLTSQPAGPGRSQERLKRMSNEELSHAITRCEDAIAEGSAEIGDFELFVLCQRELARRTWT